MNEVKQMLIHAVYHDTAGGQVLLTLMAGETKGSDSGTWEHIATWLHFNK